MHFWEFSVHIVNWLGKTFVQPSCSHLTGKICLYIIVLLQYLYYYCKPTFIQVNFILPEITMFQLGRQQIFTIITSISCKTIYKRHLRASLQWEIFMTTRLLGWEPHEYFFIFLHSNKFKVVLQYIGLSELFDIMVPYQAWRQVFLIQF